MKTKLLTLFSLLALLLVSTAALANGRPTGVRIGRLVSGGGTNVELDVTITGTNLYYFQTGRFYAETQLLGPWITNGVFSERQVTGNGALLPYGIDWGDGYILDEVSLFGPAGGPWTGTFAHTYAIPGSYVVTVGDAYGAGIVNKGGVPFTGNPISASTRYFYGNFDVFSSSTFSASPSYYQLVAITANATVTTGTGIPTLNIYGLLAMTFVLVGTGVLLFRKPTVA